MHNFIYVFGPPGAGKSTVAQALADAMLGSYLETRPRPFWHRIYAGGVELGRRLDTGYSGTDTIEFRSGPKVAEWLRTAPARLVIGEGDRCAYPYVFDAARSGGYVVRLYYVETPTNVRDARRVARFEAGPRVVGKRHPGALPSVSFIKGRETRARNLLLRSGADVLDGLLSPSVHVDAIRARLGI